MTNTEKTTTTPIRRAGLALTAGLAALLTLSACTGSPEAETPMTSVTGQVQSSTTAVKAKKLKLDSAQAHEHTGWSMPVSQLKVIDQVSLAGEPGLTSNDVYLIQPDDKTLRAYWTGTSNGKGERRETWVDLSIADGGKMLTPKGEPSSEMVRLGDNVVGGPFVSGAFKGVPADRADTTSGRFYFAAGAPGEGPWDASEKDKLRYRVVPGAVEHGDYVYLTVEGFPGVLIAKLEKAQR